MPRRLLLGLLLAWSATAFLVELQEAIEIYDRRTVYRSDPVRWRFGTAPVEVLEKCMTEAGEIIPPGSVVIFTSPGPEASDFYRWRWAAYFLPEVDLIRPSYAGAGRIAQYLISHRVPIQHPRAELVKPLTGCRLYSVKPL
jgi:hypothetical protein